jgi:hypothetical protein
MITVEKIQEAVRQEGLNFGLPEVFIRLGVGQEFATVEDLVKEIVVHTKPRWVCILGEDTTQVGLGSLVKGLSVVGCYIEIECSGRTRDPGWLHSVDRWVVDYVESPTFNIGALRSGDMVRFVVKGKGDLSSVKEGFEQLRLFPGTRYVKVEADGKGVPADLYREAFELVKYYERARLYLC